MFLNEIRFSAFIKDKWAEGAGELGKHVRANGGMQAPWLKVRRPRPKKSRGFGGRGTKMILVRRRLRF